MKILMKEIYLIRTDTDKKGVIYPLKYKIENEAKELVTILIKHIRNRKEEKLAGNRMLIFVCDIEIDNIERIIELKYEFSTCKWYLFKM